MKQFKVYHVAYLLFSINNFVVEIRIDIKMERNDWEWKIIWKEYKRWCESAEFDEETKSELISIMGDEKRNWR